MEDKIIFLLFYLAIAISAVFIWMRLVLKRKGQEYSYINNSWSVLYAYLEQVPRDKDLKSKLIRFIIIDIVILILISVLTILA